MVRIVGFIILLLKVMVCCEVRKKVTVLRYRTALEIPRKTSNYGT